MSPLVRELLVNGLMAGTAMSTARKTSAGVGYYAGAAGVGAVGLVFLSIAGYGFLLQSVSMPVAAAATGIFLVLIAISIWAWGRHAMGRKRSAKKPSLDGSFLDSVEGSVKSLLEGFEEPVKDNPKMALLLAALAGFAAGDQLGDRVH